LPGVEIGTADRPDLALLFQLGVGAERLFIRRLGVRPMREIEVDIVGLQPPE
jgi:hypothetical protein